ncbi:MAG: outer membrane beta-barrel protein [Pseudomonadota bacterium]
MKRFSIFGAAAVALVLPELASAQSTEPAPGPTGNNPTSAGLYVEGLLGLNLLGDIDVDIEGVADDAVIRSKVGAFGAVAAGFNLPQGPINIRLEGELSIRGNKLDEFEFADGTSADGIDDSVTNAYAGMVNAHLDVYVLRNLALTAGAGLGYAWVKADTIVDVNGIDAVVFDDETDTTFAYQGRVGARYDLTSNASITAAYTYFATGEVTVEDGVGVESTFEYASHGITGGLAYRF